MYFDQGYFFFFLPLCVLPWLYLPLQSLTVRNLPILPNRRESKLFELLVRLSFSIGIFFLVCGLANPMVDEQTIERTGSGAEIVLMLDRSRSMDQPYGKVDPNRSLIINTDKLTSKSQAAREVLTEFIKKRPNDFFGLVNFSSRPIRVFPLTREHDGIKGAISSATLGKGLAETDIAAVLLEGLEYFENRPYTASRVLMLISDGGDQIDPVTRLKIKQLANKYRISIYWIYLRGRGSPGISDDQQNSAGSGAVPEYFLNQYFREIGVPYQVYEASDSEQLKTALEKINKLQKLPTRFNVTLPPKSLSLYAFVLALIFLAPLTLVAFLEVSKWEKSDEKT